MFSEKNDSRFGLFVKPAALWSSSPCKITQHYLTSLVLTLKLILGRCDSCSPVHLSLSLSMFFLKGPCTIKKEKQVEIQNSLNLGTGQLRSTIIGGIKGDSAGSSGYLCPLPPLEALTFSFHMLKLQILISLPGQLDLHTCWYAGLLHYEKVLISDLFFPLCYDTDD